MHATARRKAATKASFAISGAGGQASPQRRQVALLIETSNAYARGLLAGVTAYLREHQAWSIYISEQGRGDAVPHWLSRWKGQGILARVENQRIARAVAERQLPTVDLSAARLLPGVPWVETDDAAIAQLAFEHLVDRGYRRLGFCGLSNFNWSRWRCEHFRNLAGQAWLSCDVHMSRMASGRAGDYQADQNQLIHWVEQLPKPVGVLACYDIRGRQLLDACRSLGVRVPDDVAVLGVDNDSVVCELADPSLSSVVPNTHRTGYIAAGLLDQLMSGKAVPAERHLISPLGVIARRSSDALALDDPDISAAVRYIREHACEGIGIEQVLAVVPLSRRVFESRFSRLLGRTPHDEIIHVQVQRAKELLTQTDLPLKAIAQRLGIRHPEYFNVLFKRATGKPPGMYRKENRS